MRRTTTLMPVGALALALTTFAALPAAAQDRNGRDRSGRHSDGQARERQSDGARGGARDRQDGQNRPSAQGDSRERPAPRADVAPPSGQGRPGIGADRGSSPAPVPDRADRYGVPDRRADGRARDNVRGGVAVPRPYDDRRYESRRGDDRRRDDRAIGPRGGYDAYRNDRYRYGAGPRLVVPVRPWPHYYGSNGRFSVYFGSGSGYLFGAPYSGRVYGYITPRGYSARVYYGDVRLIVNPRDAEVYVDGYYAGIVDSFDGVFQRLTLEVGPHQIELNAPGLEPQFYDVYVDPAQTVTIRSELYRY